MILKRTHAVYGGKAANASRRVKDAVVSSSHKAKTVYDIRNANRELHKRMKLKDTGIIASAELENNTEPHTQVLRAGALE
jgi:hypothetical protein